MKNLLIGIIIGFLIGAGVFYLLMEHYNQKSYPWTPRHGEKSAPVDDIATVMPNIFEYRKKYPQYTQLVVHSIESIKLFVQDFDSLVKNQELLPQTGLTWELGVYPFIDKNNGDKISFYFIPTLAHKSGGVLGSSTNHETFNNIIDYYGNSTNPQYYKQSSGHQPGFVSVYDLGNVYP